MRRKKGQGKQIIAVVCVLLLLLVFIGLLCSYQARVTKAEAKALLVPFQETILLKLQDTYNYAADLSAVIQAKGDQTQLVESMIQRPECEYLGYLEGTTMTAFEAKDSHWKNDINKDIQELDYAYTLARITKKTVVEGPVTQEGKELFLIIEPICTNAKEGEEGIYWGEVVVALDANMILEKCNLDWLTKNGFEYELWRVNPLDGYKDSIAISSKEVDLSKGIETKFDMPTPWTLSIMPKEGWYNKTLLHSLILAAGMIAVGFSILVYVYGDRKRLLKEVQQFDKVDAETGFYNRKTFLQYLKHWTEEKTPFVILYLIWNDYHRITQLGTVEDKEKLLSYLQIIFRTYVKSEHLTARLSECGFVLAIKEDMTQRELDCLKKGLSLELLYKVVRKGETSFLTADCSNCQFPQDGTDPEELLQIVIEQSYQ